MEKTIHFMSGPPRSGSSLICNILCQNPRFHASPTSGLVDVLYQIRNHWHTLAFHKANPCQQKLNHVLAATMTAYYADIDRPVIIDRSRGWLPHVELAECLLGRKAKILVPVRPILDILASFELLYRETGKFRQPPGEAANYHLFQTVTGRCDYLLRGDQVVGGSISRLQDVVVRGLKDRLLFIDFDRLTRQPRQVFAEIYRFLDEDYYEHDFDHVEQVIQEDDDVHGYTGLHRIRSKVEPVDSRAVQVLGQDYVEAFKSRGLSLAKGTR